MKKRLLVIIAAVTLIAAQAMGVCAAGSRTANVIPAGDSAGKYEITEADEAGLAYLETSAPQVHALIMDIQNGTKDIDSIAEAVPELKTELEGKSLVTNFFDLEPINGGVLTEEGKFIVTLSVPELTEALTDIRLLHYSTERDLWEIIEPNDVDYANKQIVAEFEDLSPVAIIAKVDESKLTNKGDSNNAGKGTSPQTGVESVWGIYMGGAILLFAAAGALFVKAGKKQRRED